MNSTTGTLSFYNLEALWVEAGGATALAPIMAAIALGESSGAPNAYNANDTNGAGGTQVSAGLWQISNGTQSPVANWSDPLTNAEYAVQKLQTQGLGAWGLAGLDVSNLPAAISQIDAHYKGRVSALLGGLVPQSSFAPSSSSMPTTIAVPFAADWSSKFKMAVVIIGFLLIAFGLLGSLKS